MNEDSMLILQMTHALIDGMNKLEGAYNSNNYVELEKAKKALLEMQDKLNRLLKE